MKKVHIFSYHQIVATDQLKSVESFAEQTHLAPNLITELAIAERNVSGSIYQYNTGNIGSKQFRSSLNEKFKNEGGLTLDNQNFDKCWNAMCAPQQQTFEQLYQLQQTYKFKIQVIGNTNEIQHNYIQSEVQKFTSKPDITYILSFEEKTVNSDKLKQSLLAIFPDEYQFEFHNVESADAVTILANIYEPITNPL